jgi:hypothetical protein
MDRVFLLWHEHDDDGKLIGVYSSEENAIAARGRVGNKPGFADSPEGFTVDPYRIDEDHWTEGYVTV